MKSRVAVSKTLAPPPSESEDGDEGEDEEEELTAGEEELTAGEEEEEEEDSDPTPAPNRIRKHTDGGAAGIKNAARRLAEVANTREDSIMDSSDEEDADEVDDLL